MGIIRSLPPVSKNEQSDIINDYINYLVDKYRIDKNELINKSLYCGLQSQEQSMFLSQIDSKDWGKYQFDGPKKWLMLVSEERYAGVLP